MPGLRDFVTGFAEETASQQREKNKLSLAMESRAVEAQLEHQRAMEMAQFQHQLGSINPQQMGALAKVLGAQPEQVSGLSGLSENVPQGLAGTVFSGLSKEIREYIAKNYPDYKNDEACQIRYADGKPMYAVEISKGKDGLELLFDGENNFVKTGHF